MVKSQHFAPIKTIFTSGCDSGGLVFVHFCHLFILSEQIIVVKNLRAAIRKKHVASKLAWKKKILIGLKIAQAEG